MLFCRLHIMILRVTVSVSASGSAYAPLEFHSQWALASVWKIPLQNVDADPGNGCGTYLLALMLWLTLTLTVNRPSEWFLHGQAGARTSNLSHAERECYHCTTPADGFWLNLIVSFDYILQIFGQSTRVQDRVHNKSEALLVSYLLRHMWPTLW